MGSIGSVRGETDIGSWGFPDRVTGDTGVIVRRQQGCGSWLSIPDQVGSQEPLLSWRYIGGRDEQQRDQWLGCGMVVEWPETVGEVGGGGGGQQIPVLEQGDKRGWSGGASQTPLIYHPHLTNLLQPPLRAQVNLISVRPNTWEPSGLSFWKPSWSVTYWCRSVRRFSTLNQPIIVQITLSSIV